MRKEIDIPKGTKKIIIDVQGGKMLVMYEPVVEGTQFTCQETGETEHYPGTGDFVIAWNCDKRDNAVCLNFVRLTCSGNNMCSDGNIYDRVIKFRNYEQYLKVRGVYEDGFEE